MNDDEQTIIERPTIPALMESDARIKGDQIVIAVCVRVEHFDKLRRFRGKEVDLVLAQTEISASANNDDQLDLEDAPYEQLDDPEGFENEGEGE